MVAAATHNTASNAQGWWSGLMNSFLLSLPMRADPHPPHAHTGERAPSVQLESLPSDLLLDEREREEVGEGDVDALPLAVGALLVEGEAAALDLGALARLRRDLHPAAERCGGKRREERFTVLRERLKICCHARAGAQCCST